MISYNILLLLISIISSSTHLPSALPTSSAGTSQSPSSPPGKFVPFSKLSTCPSLSPRKSPKHAKDVRPDDFKVILALGDSITAGFLARGSRDGTSLHGSHHNQKPLAINEEMGSITRFPGIEEWRGLSYATGSDENAITIPNILTHYTSGEGGKNQSLIGSSTGHHSPISCLGIGWNIGCGSHPESDGLNAAISGSLSKGLMAQVKDYLVPKVLELGIRDEDWKYVNLAIGANDVCAFCLAPNATAFPLSGTPQHYARDIKEAVNELRKHVPNMIVNIVGLFRVSDIYELTTKDPYCQAPHLPLPNLALECSCALIPGPIGDYTRQKMDDLGRAYDEAVFDVIKEWEEEDDPSFGAIWQPGTAIDIANYPFEALSKIDCFHPSELSHQRVASGLWNRLTLSLEDKYVPIPWEEEPMIRCLEEDDRIQLGEISKRSMARPL